MSISGAGSIGGPYYPEPPAEGPEPPAEVANDRAALVRSSTPPGVPTALASPAMDGIEPRPQPAGGYAAHFGERQFGRAQSVDFEVNRVALIGQRRNRCFRPFAELGGS